MWTPSLPRVHVHLLSSDQERHLWSPKYFKFPCVCIHVYFHPENSSFFGEFFLSYLPSYPYFGAFLSTWSRNVTNFHLLPFPAYLSDTYIHPSSHVTSAAWIVVCKCIASLLPRSVGDRLPLTVVVRQMPHIVPKVRLNCEDITLCRTSCWLSTVLNLSKKKFL